MCIDNYLPERILISRRLFWIHCNGLQKSKHCWDSLRMNAILRFFKTEHASCIWLLFNNCESKKPERAIGQRSCGMLRAISKTRHERQQFPLLISVDPHILNVVNKL